MSPGRPPGRPALAVDAATNARAVGAKRICGVGPRPAAPEWGGVVVGTDGGEALRAEGGGETGRGGPGRVRAETNDERRPVRHPSTQGQPHRAHRLLRLVHTSEAPGRDARSR